MKKSHYFVTYPKVIRKANTFARREYETDGYERQWLSKGYYHGYIAGVQAMYKLLLATKAPAMKLLALELRHVLFGLERRWKIE